MRKLSQKSSTICLFLILIFSYSTAIAADRVASSSELRRKTNELAIVSSTLPNSMDPASLWHYLHFLVLGACGQTLVISTSNGSIVSDLAKTWKIPTDGLEYVFNLNPSATFSDGSPVTSDDVVFSLTRQFWPNNKSITIDNLSHAIEGGKNAVQGKNISGIRALSKSTVSIKLNKRYPPLLKVLSIPGFVILKKIEAEKGSFIFSGSYIPQLFKDDKIIILTRRQDINHPSKIPAKIQLEEFSDENKLLSRIKNDEFDLTLGFSSNDFIKNLPSTYIPYKVDSLGFLHFFYNARKFPFNNDELRKDFGSVLREIMQTSIEKNYSLEPQANFLPRGIMPHSYYKVNRSVLDISKFKSKWLPTLKNTKLTIYIGKGFSSEIERKSLENSLKNLGLNLEVVLDSASKIVPKMRSGEFDMALMGFVATISDPDGFISSINEENRFQLGKYPSKDFIHKIDEIRNLFPAEKRLEEYTRIFHDFESKNYFVPLYKVYLPVVANQYLQLPVKRFEFEFSLSHVTWK